MGKKKKQSGGGGDDQPAWLVTFTDLMTLLLTFFVLLVSMATLDERRKLIVLGSIIGTFGTGQSHDVLSTVDTRRAVEPGPMELEKSADLEPLKEMVWEDVNKDLDFAQNKFVQVFTINTDTLFEPGDVHIKPEGRQLLESLLPVLLQIEQPLLVAGHTSNLRDEQGVEYRVAQDETVDPSWRISMGRAMAVYRFLLDAGMDSEMLRMEAFGKYHPRYSSQTADERRRNRRVDLVLDKRNVQWMDRMGARPEEPDDGKFDYKGFLFRFDQGGGS